MDKARLKVKADGGRACRNLYQFIRARLGREVSDREIARRWGMEWKSFAALKHGERHLPRLGELERLATLLTVDAMIVIDIARGGDPSRATAARADLRAQLDRINDAIFTLDTHGRFHDANAAFLSLIGQSQSALMNHSLLDLVTEESTAQAVALIGTLARGEPVSRWQIVFTRAGGAELVLEVNATPIRGADGKPIGAQLLARDVSIEHLVARDLNKQRQLLQTIFERFPAACVLYDTKRKIIAANPMAERFSLRPVSEMVGRRAEEVFGESAAVGPAKRALATGQIEQQVALLQGRDGEPMYVHRTAGPIMQGAVVNQILEILVDVTDAVRHGDVRLLAFWGSPDDGDGAPLEAERRRAQRTEVAFDAQLRHGKRVQMVRVENLGSGGLFIQTTAKLKKGTRVELEWQLPHDHVPVRAKGVVAWIRPKSSHDGRGVGVRFLDVVPASNVTH
jgi:uncharacterized protein (TIGR02266 family)